MIKSKAVDYIKYTGDNIMDVGNLLLKHGYSLPTIDQDDEEFTHYITSKVSSEWLTITCFNIFHPHIVIYEDYIKIFETKEFDQQFEVTDE